MDKSTPIKLIARTFEKDNNGASHAVETERTVFCNVKSAGQKEFMEGGRNGLNPQYQFTMFRFDYLGESIVEYEGSRYAVYRTFQSQDKRTLFLEGRG